MNPFTIDVLLLATTPNYCSNVMNVLSTVAYRKNNTIAGALLFAMTT